MKIAAFGIACVVAICTAAGYSVPTVPARMALKRVQPQAPSIASYGDSASASAVTYTTHTWAVAGTPVTCIIATDGFNVYTSGYPNK